jgi:hypothetical protein
MHARGQHVANGDISNNKTSFNPFPGKDTIELRSNSTSFSGKLGKKIYRNFHIPKVPYHKSLFLAILLPREKITLSATAEKYC